MLKSKFILRPVAVAAMFCAAGAAQAAITIYTDLASFNAAVSAPGTDNFQGLTAIVPDIIAGSVTRSAGPYSYTASVPVGSGDFLFSAGTAANTAITTNNTGGTIIFDTFSAGVVAVGGDFYASDFNGSYQAGTITVTASDGGSPVSYNIAPVDINGFLGFVSTGPMVSLTVTTLNSTHDYWPTVDNLTLAVAAVVPEPGSYALMIAGLCAVGFVVSRRRG